MVMCASRDRNVALDRMVESVRRTSTKADIAVYIDEDQRQMYPEIGKGMYGPRIGVVPSINQLWEANPGYDAYGWATDDCEFTSPKWDEWVLKTSSEFPGEVGAMSPRLNSRDRMDFPWLTRRWTEALGWFAWPGALHYYWDIYLELLGEKVGIRYATKAEFGIEHDSAPAENITEKVRHDGPLVLTSIAMERRSLIDKLLAAQAKYEERYATQAR